MAEHILVGISLMIVIGIFVQWISWKLKLPSILILIIAGIIAGPVTEIVQPDKYFGELLFPMISISVAIILFEGGLNLKIKELLGTGKVLRNLITTGLAVTWIFATAASVFILNLDLNISILLGAILVVTGPTVIIPILKELRLSGQSNYIAKWEGIVNDPVGALLTILVFEGILAEGFNEVTTQAIWGITKTIIFATAIGAAGFWLILILIKSNLLPEALQSPVTLAVVIAVFTASNLIQLESGLFAVTIMGILLGNQKSAEVKSIVKFKENLRVLLISFLFIVLSARLNISDISLLDINSFIFVAILILIIRPAAVLLSTFNSKLTWKEKLMLSWMAPRGIVAAAVASLISLKLVNAGYPDSVYLAPVVFFVIVSTITVYGLTARPLGRILGLIQKDPQGVIILGAHKFAREIGKSIKHEGFDILLVDTNIMNISAAKENGLNTYYGSILSEKIEEEIDLNNYGRLLALTINKEVNSLAAIYFSEHFGKNEVYQLSVEVKGDEELKKLSEELRGRTLFGKEYSYEFLDKLFHSGIIQTVEFKNSFSYKDFVSGQKERKIIPLFIVTSEKKLMVYSTGSNLEPRNGEKLIYLSLRREIIEKENFYVSLSNSTSSPR